MKAHDPEGRNGPSKPLPDSVVILEPPLDKLVLEPSSESKEPAPFAPAPAAPAPEAPAETYAGGEGYGQAGGEGYVETQAAF